MHCIRRLVFPLRPENLEILAKQLRVHEALAHKVVLNQQAKDIFRRTVIGQAPLMGKIIPSPAT
jgi:hypothetical protein